VLPALLRELLEIDRDERPSATPLVSRDVLLAALLRRIEIVLPGARILAPFYVSRGRVDLAVFHEGTALGVLLEPSEPFGGGVRTGRGTEAFDHTIAVAAYPKDHLLDEKPEHVWGFRAFLGFDGLPVFALARPAASPAAPSSEARRRLLALSERTHAPALDGDAVTEALLAHLEARYEAIAMAREFPCGGSVADVAVITGSELHLFEIKGAADSAARLAKQVPNYDLAASTCTLVTTCNHRSFRARVPAHWGLIEAARVRGAVRFMHLRAPQSNPNAVAARLVDLLQAQDLRRILRSRNGACPVSGVPLMRRTLLETAGDEESAHLALQALARRVRPV